MEVTYGVDFSQGKVTVPQRDSLLDALQQKHLDLMRQITLVRETLHIREQSFSELQTQHEELQGRLEEYQEKVTDLEDEVVVSAASWGRC